MVSGFLFRLLIHFEFMFVFGERKLSYLILLHAVVQFSQHNLLKKQTFSSIVYSCILCYRLIDHKLMDLFLGSLLCSIDLCV